MKNLKGKRVAILATDGFEYSELVEPEKALQEAGADIDIISLEEGTIRGWKDGNWSMHPAHVTKTVEEANPAEYSGLVLPGGVMSPDKLRTDRNVRDFVRGFFEQGKPVAAICHGPWTLIDAEVVEGRTMTSYHSIRKDLENAGAKWVDKPVVVDHGLVTSRHPGDLEAFSKKVVEEIGEGVHKAQRQSV